MYFRKDQSLIEEGHVTSKILSADSTIIKTSCYIYHLIGELIDTNNSKLLSYLK